MNKKAINEKLRFDIAASECAALGSLLGAEIAQKFGPRDETPLSILSYATDGALIAGLNALAHWRWLYIRHLWVREDYRGMGYGGQLIDAAQMIAQERDYAGLYIDTFEQSIADFYEKKGFTRSGAIKDFPLGGTRIFLSKALHS